MKNTGKISAIALYSGGLDSCLAIKAILLQGIHVIAVYFNTPFSGRCKTGEKTDSRIKTLQERAEKSGAEFYLYSTGDDYIEMVSSPRYSYGAHMNPCIDCKIFFYKKAAEIMEERGADFLITGEVLGQRSMTQTKQMLMTMEKRAEVQRLVLRPLSAKLLPMTIPEEKGWVARELLYDIQGRSRSRQFELARQWDISDYPTPAGGCLLTDPQFSIRLKDLFDHSIYNLNDIVLLKAGRHFRLSDSVKMIVGRNEDDNRYLSSLIQSGDILLEVCEYGSPLCILRGEKSDEFVATAVKICKRYSKAKDVRSAKVKTWKVGEEYIEIITVKGTIDEKSLKEKML